jgi:hypothetical protein
MMKIGKGWWSAILILAVAISLQCIGQEQIDPKLTEVWEPEPPVVSPGVNGAPPSDAIVLFDGTSFEHWKNVKDSDVEWKLENGAMIVVKKTGPIISKQSFADCQLHVEFRTPEEVSGKGQGRGNSGIFLQSRYEVQVLDSYQNRTYSNGQAGSIYKQHSPLVNASLPPGEWQTYDIYYIAPRFSENGLVQTPAYITVIHNGVLIQNHVEIKGSTVFRGEPKYELHDVKEPIMLQDHTNPVSYRNIWIREI